MKLNSLRIALFFIISLCILSLILGFLTYKNTLVALGAWNNSNKMLVFLKTDTTEDQRNELIAKIRASAQVKSVDLVDRKIAGQSFQNSLKDYANSLLTNDELLDLIPETLEVDLSENLSLGDRQANFSLLANTLKDENSVDEISYSANWLEKFDRIDRFVRSAGVFVFLLILILMSYLVSLMLRVYVDDSKAEIEVYNLLGATRWSIYKLYISDLFVFLTLSLFTATGLSFVLFSYFKMFLAHSGLSKLIAENMTYLSPTELLGLLFVLSAAILAHSFITISSSVNKLNQITND